MTIWVCEKEPKEHGEHQTKELAILEFEGMHMAQAKGPPEKLTRLVCPICRSSVKVKT